MKNKFLYISFFILVADNIFSSHYEDSGAVTSSSPSGKAVDREADITHNPIEIIKNIHESPYSAYGWVTTKLEDRIYIGTGVLVGPRHVLTAGYNLFFRTYGVAADSVSFSLRRDDECIISHDGKDNKIVPHRRYVEAKSEEEARQYDIGMLILKHPVEGEWLEVESLDDGAFVDKEVTIIGYPSLEHLKMHKMSGLVISISTDKVVYDVDTTVGTGGAGGFLSGSKGKIHFIHLGTESDGSGNSGIRINSEISEWVSNIIRKYN